ncbi:hypothetical protein HDV00_008765 [Rhizophlyctis rosea]|nr:hypothetical protein HDV00_008765 [Rhizophlyctis rosea]
MFDAAIDEVLQMIYFNTFKKFIAAKEREAEQAESEPKSSPSRRSSIYQPRSSSESTVSAPPSTEVFSTIGRNATSASAMEALQRDRREKRHSKSLDLSSGGIWQYASTTASQAGDSLSSLASRSRIKTSRSATNISTSSIWAHEADAPPLPSTSGSVYGGGGGGGTSRRFANFRIGGMVSSSGRSDYRYSVDDDDGMSDSGVSFMSTRSRLSVVSSKFKNGISGMRDRVRGGR